MEAGKRPLAVAALALLAIIWGYNWVVMKIATRYAPAFEFAAIRLLVGCAILFGVMVIMRKPLRPSNVRAYVLIGVFQSGLFVALATWAIVTAGAGKVSVLAYTMPIWVAALAWPFLHERLNAIKVVGLIIAAAGIALVVDIRHGGNKLLAEAVAVAAGVAWAIGVIITKRLQTHEKPDLLSLTTWQMLFGGAVAAIAALIADGPATQWSAVYIGALAYNAVLASALAYLMWIFALQHLPARDASIGTLANPVIGITAAWLQLGERPSLSEAMGMALVVAALLLLAFSSSAQQQGIADDKQA